MSWGFDELGKLKAVAMKLSGVFVLSQVPMSHADYWVLVNIDTLSPACDDPNNGLFLFKFGIGGRGEGIRIGLATRVCSYK